jgi:ABC-type branched-subunit amino acid transport system substrate-binding protein
MRTACAAALLVAAVSVAGCGGGSGSQGAATLTVYVSAPLQGGRSAQGRGIVNGARLALAQHGGRVGELKLRAVYLDDTRNGRWSLVRTADNARRAAEDGTAIGYIGDLDSGATRISLPITNQAEMVQISPGSTAVDLTRQAPGGLGPGRYQPSGGQTFARVVPADDVQARAAAAWAKQLGGRRAVPIGADGYTFQVPSGPGGTPRRYLTSPFIYPAQLPPRGQRFVNQYTDLFHQSPDPAAAYGYESMALLLDAIKRAGSSGDDRGAVIDNVLSTHDRHSVLGTYSIDSDGDTTLRSISGYRIAAGQPVFDTQLTAPR